MPVVTFRMESGPARSTQVEPGATVRDAARAAGVPLVAPCGGRGRCGRCVVEVLGDAPPPTEREAEILSATSIGKGLRLACETRVTGEFDLALPASSRGEFAEILADGECIAFPLEPAVRAVDVSLPEPSLDDPRSDLARLAEALDQDRSPQSRLPAHPSAGPAGQAGSRRRRRTVMAEALRLPGLAAELDAARELPGVLRANGFSAEVLVRGRRLLRARPPGERLRVLGAAFDIGTTTVAGSLVDLATGERLAVASRTNPQHAVGDDVVSRMDHAAKGRASLAELQGLMRDCLNELIDEMTRGAAVSADDIHDVVAAGNTVMTHLFLGLPPGAMATVPFTPVVTAPVDVPAADLGLHAARGARVWTAPSAAAYVGGDVIAGMTALGFGGLRRQTIYIDIGTNGEVVAGSGDRALCAATAAGPAFEGARISCGMRAVEGAIAHAELRGGDLALDVIGGAPPSGLCGTGLVDVVAALLRAGVVDATGRIAPRSGSALASRVREGREPQGAPEFVVASRASGAPGQWGEVVLTQKDVRELQLAKAAIAAGAGTLLDRLGIDAADVRQVLLAGAFGSTIRPASAVAIGLLPAGVAADRVRAVGNTAASGARAAVVSASAREEAERLARWIEPVELSADAGFQARFVEAMMFCQDLEEGA